MKQKENTGALSVFFFRFENLILGSLYVPPEPVIRLEIKSGPHIGA